MIIWLIYSAVSMGILLLFYHTVLIKEKMYRINRGYLLFSLVFSLIIPFVPVGITGPLLQFDQPTQTVSTEISERNSPVYHDAGQLAEGDIIIPAGENGTASKDLMIPLLIGFYSAVALILFARLFRIIHMIQLKSNRNPRTLFEGYEVVLLRENVVPHTFLGTIFVNKKQFERGGINRNVLLHELAHVKQKHSIDILSVELLKILLWFNPLLYLYKKAIHLNHEFLADEAVLTTGVSVTDYQKTLLETLLLKPSHSLASSLHFGLTKKRLQMMTQSINKTTSVMKILSLIPLFLLLALFLGCESTPADSQSSTKEITIEMTDGEMILLNGEQMNVSDLDKKLQELSEKHVLNFIVKDHPGMKSGPVFTVNSLVHQYTTPENGRRQSVVQIKISSENEIIVDEQILTLDELHTLLDERLSDRSLIISLRVVRGADIQTIHEVQNLLRTQGSRRINYSTVNGEAESELTRITQEYLRQSAIYMELNTSEVSLPELEHEYTLLMGLLEEMKETMQYIDFPPPPPPIPSSPHTRLGLSPETSQNETVPAPPAPVEKNNLLTILINAQGMMLVNEEPETVEGIKNRVKEFVDNHGADPALSSSPGEAILSIRTDSRLEYDTYLEILDEVMAAYQELRDEASRNRFGVPFSSLEESGVRFREIRDAYPKRISIAEPAGRG